MEFNLLRLTTYRTYPSKKFDGLSVDILNFETDHHDRSLFFIEWIKGETVCIEFLFHFEVRFFNTEK